MPGILLSNRIKGNGSQVLSASVLEDFYAPGDSKVTCLKVLCKGGRASDGKMEVIS